MYSRAVTAAVVVMASVSTVSAQGFSGDLGIGFYTLTDDGDLGQTSYSGSLEYAITPGFAIAGDLAAYNNDGLFADATTATIHGIYHLDRVTSFGLFLGQEWTDDDASDVIGVEAATNLFGVDVEGFAGQVRTDDPTSFFGASGAYPLMNEITLTGDMGLVGVDGDSFNRISAGAEYGMPVGPVLFGEVGRIGSDTDGNTESSTFIGIGARLDFGADGGPTFGRRSPYDLIPAR